MRVKIVSCFNDEWWHEKYISEEVEVIEWSHDAWFALGVEECGGVLPKRDCKVVKGDNKMGEYTFISLVKFLDVNPREEFEAVATGGRKYNAKMLKGELYITTEGLSDCVVPAATIPMNLKWKIK